MVFLYFLDYARSTRIVPIKTTKNITATEGTPHQTLDVNLSTGAITRGNHIPIIIFSLLTTTDIS